MKENCHLEISKNNLKNNFLIFRKILENNGNNGKIFSVVKSNAYGHGILEITKILENEKCVDGFVVSNFKEAEFLRENKIKLSILCVGFISRKYFLEAFKKNIDMIFYNFDDLCYFEKLAKKNNFVANVFLKIETGTNRQGIKFENLMEFLEKIKTSKYLNLKGISTHFAKLENIENETYTNFQLQNFRKAIKIVEKRGFENVIKTASASAGLFHENLDLLFDIVRIGIIGYGLWPSQEIKNKFCKQYKIKPVLSWKTKIVQIKNLSKNDKVSYGCTFVAQAQMKIAILPVGYFEGFFRSLSNKGFVLINDKKAKVLGMVCMNMIMVDITNIEAKVYDEVIIIGKSDTKKITAEKLGKLAGTINYELVSCISSFVPKIVV